MFLTADRLVVKISIYTTDILDSKILGIFIEKLSTSELKLIRGRVLFKFRQVQYPGVDLTHCTIHILKLITHELILVRHV